MRAREFVEDGTQGTQSFKTLIQNLITQSPKPDPNAKITPKGPVSGYGSQNPSTYSASGGATQQPQGVPKIPTSGQPSQNQSNSLPVNPQDISKIQPAQLLKFKGQPIELPGITGKFTIGDPTNTADGPGFQIKSDPKGPFATDFQVPLKNLLTKSKS